MIKIGVLDVRGSMPYYEELPFNIHVTDKGVIKDLDALIIPPGSQVESRVLERYPWIYKEVWDFVDRGGLVIGVCSGLQLLSKAINLNVKGLPGYINGLGILDVVVEPLIVTGPVRVKIIKETWVTRGLLHTELNGWHAHTYGRLIVGDEDTAGLAVTRRFNYTNKYLELPSLVVSRKYEVFGTLTHGLLNKDSPIINNVLNKLDFHGDPSTLYEDYREHDWKISVNNINHKINDTKIIVVTSTMSSEGKTLISTAIAHCLSKMGYSVGIAKLGGDIRDLHPSLYVLRKPLKPWMSVELTWGNSRLGLLPWDDAIKKAPRLDVIVVEGVMGLLTGSSRDGDAVSSTLGFIKRIDGNTVLVASASLDGVEGVIFRTKAYLDLLRTLNVKVKLVVINNVYHDHNEDLLVKNFMAELKQMGINVVVIDKLNVISKPEELMDLGDYEEATFKIEEESGLCEALMNSQGLQQQSGLEDH